MVASIRHFWFVRLVLVAVVALVGWSVAVSEASAGISVDLDAGDVINSGTLVLDDDHNYGRRIDGASADDTVTSVAWVGDVNGDSYDDQLIGAANADGGNGRAYVVFGNADMNDDSYSDRELDLSGIPGNGQGIVIKGGSNAHLGSSVAGGGDFNGDNISDFAVGAYDAGGVGKKSGAVYVFFGVGSGETLSSQYASSGYTNSIRLYGGDNAGGDASKVNFVNDMNGDGMDEVIVGDPDFDDTGRSNCGTFSYNCGAAFVVFGKTGNQDIILNPQWKTDFAYREDGTTTTSEKPMLAYTGTGRDYPYGIMIDGVHANDHLGWSVDGKGDIDGNGKGDVVVGAPKADVSGKQSGTAYVLRDELILDTAETVEGIHADDASKITSEDLRIDATAGWKIKGKAEDDYAGFSVAIVGDTNDDGRDELAVGAPQADSDSQVDSGLVMLVSGDHEAGSGTSDITMKFESGDTWTIIAGESGKADSKNKGDRLGASISSAGLMDNDTNSDLLIGAPGYDGGLSVGNVNMGAVYVYYGQDTESAGAGREFNNEIKFGSDDDSTDRNGDRVWSRIVGAVGCESSGLTGLKCEKADSGRGGELGGDFDTVTFGDGATTGNHWWGDQLVAGGHPGTQPDSSDANGDAQHDILVGTEFADYDSKTNSGSAFVILGPDVLYESGGMCFGSASGGSSGPGAGGVITPGGGSDCGSEYDTATRYVSVGREMSWEPTTLVRMGNRPDEGDSNWLSPGLDISGMVQEGIAGLLGASYLDYEVSDGGTTMPTGTKFSLYDGEIAGTPESCDEVGQRGDWTVKVHTPLGEATQTVRMKVNLAAGCVDIGTKTGDGGSGGDGGGDGGDSGDSGDGSVGSQESSSGSSSSSSSSSDGSSSNSSETVNNYGDFKLTLSGSAKQKATKSKYVYVYAKPNAAAKLSSSGRISAPSSLRKIKASATAKSANANEKRIIKFSLSAAKRKKITAALKKGKKVYFIAKVAAVDSTSGRTVTKTKKIRIISSSKKKSKKKK